MALTFTNNKHFQPMRGGWKKGVVDITFDNSYPTGGEAVTAANLGLRTLYNLITPPIRAGSNLGFVTSWDHVNRKIVVYESGTADAGLGELNSTSSALDGLTIRCEYLGY